ncbi:hypothetical protein [Streptomyces microflavus]|uniref:hypothetical protein n=1 Tax=Streptomyces microflavus TaxID=1919 RepID=UPI0036EA54AC
MSATTTTKRRSVPGQTRVARVQESIGAAVACPLCPEVTPEHGVEVLMKAVGPQHARRSWYSSNVIHDSARELTGDPEWCERALQCIDAYRAAHGHGPTWRTFWSEPSLWPADASMQLLTTVMRQLSEGGHLDGTRTPFGLRRREA